MKAYYIDAGQTHEGIPVSLEPYAHIGTGIKHFRRRTWIPISEQAQSLITPRMLPCVQGALFVCKKEGEQVVQICPKCGESLEWVLNPKKEGWVCKHPMRGTYQSGLRIRDVSILRLSQGGESGIPYLIVPPHQEDLRVLILWQTRTMVAHPFQYNSDICVLGTDHQRTEPKGPWDKRDNFLGSPEIVALLESGQSISNVRSWKSYNQPEFRTTTFTVTHSGSHLIVSMGEGVASSAALIPVDAGECKYL